MSVKDSTGFQLASLSASEPCPGRKGQSRKSQSDAGEGSPDKPGGKDARNDVAGEVFYVNGVRFVIWTPDGRTSGEAKRLSIFVWSQIKPKQREMEPNQIAIAQYISGRCNSKSITQRNRFPMCKFVERRKAMQSKTKYDKP